MKRKILSIVLSLVLVGTLVAGCSGSSTTADSGDKSLVWGETQSISSIDPAVDWNGWYTVRYAIAETLFKLDDELNPQPWLAESYENIDQNTWKITIRDNVSFSDGNALTADMVVENLKRVGSLNSRAVAFGEATYSVDGNVITITTATPYPTLINELCDPYSAIIDLASSEDYNFKPIGTGPYVVSDVVMNTAFESIDLVKNEQYWNGVPNISTVQVKFITDTDTMAMALQSGEVDVAMNLTSDSKDVFADDSNFKIEEISSARSYFMYYNMQTLTDSAIREAVSMAIDKDSIAENLLNGSVTPAVGAFPYDLAYGGSHLTGVSFDVEGAKAVLNAAGYMDSDGDGIVEKDGQPLTLDIVTYKRLSCAAIVTELQAELKAIGIQAEVAVNDNTDAIKAGEFDIALYSIVTTPVGDPESFLNSTFSTDGTTNYGNYSDAEMDTLLAELKAEFDPDKRAQLAIEIQQKALDQYAFDCVGFVNMAMYMNANVTGIAPHPTDYYQLNATMDIEE